MVGTSSSVTQEAVAMAPNLADLARSISDLARATKQTNAALNQRLDQSSADLSALMERLNRQDDQYHELRSTIRFNAGQPRSAHSSNGPGELRDGEVRTSETRNTQGSGDARNHSPRHEHSRSLPPSREASSARQEQASQDATLMPIKPRSESRPVVVRDEFRADDLSSFDPATDSLSDFIATLRTNEHYIDEAHILRLAPRCLRGDARRWFNDLGADFKTVTATLDAFITALSDKFALSQSVLIAALVKDRYTLNDSRDFGQFFDDKVRQCRATNIRDVQSMLEVIYQAVDPPIQSLLPGPEIARSLDVFRKEGQRKVASYRAERRSYAQRAQRAQPPLVTMPDRIEQDERNRDKPGPRNYRPQLKPRLPLPMPRPARACRHCGGQHWDNACPVNANNSSGKMIAAHMAIDSPSASPDTAPDRSPASGSEYTTIDDLFDSLAAYVADETDNA